VQIRVSETFLSLQGEGPAVGEPAVFLRLAGCNLSCSWCDTPYSWDWKRFDRNANSHSISTVALAAELVQQTPESVHLLVVTGGEPLLQQKALVKVLSELVTDRPDLRIEIETNGTQMPLVDLVELVHRFVVSPKLRNAGFRNTADAAGIAHFGTLNSVLKFVVRTADDVHEAASLASDAGFSTSKVWLMPEGVDEPTIGAHARAIVPEAIAMGLRVSPRLHVSIWGDERGR
jgi:7-carboxy-7-deazaguanine synthase